MDSVRAFACQGKKSTLQKRSFRLPEQGVFFLWLTLRLHLSAHLPPRSFCKGYECALAPQCVHQSGGVANLTSVLKRIFGVSERGLWTAKHPESQRPIS